jgi:hypothetical protein
MATEEYMIDFLQQLFSGVALGCVYGLIALGFVLIYKATEVVNFAQGEVMMIGAFLSYTFIATLGLNYWLGFAMCIVCMAIIGSLIERLVDIPVTLSEDALLPQSEFAPMASTAPMIGNEYVVTTIDPISHARHEGDLPLIGWAAVNHAQQTTVGLCC